ncbi:MAG: hypothetical protein JW719_09670 [Pirellulales bacterium]|nr:hypothetical protein [Pirellulales bacterium]
MPFSLRIRAIGGTTKRRTSHGRAAGVVLKIACWVLVLTVWAGGSAVWAGAVSVAPLPAIAARATTGPVLPVALSPLEQRLFDDAADGRLDEHSLLAAAMVAGGETDPARINRDERRVEGLVEQWRATTVVSGTPRQQAAAVFEFMHGRILRGGYDLDATLLTTAVEQGRFNCVSASVLFCHLATRFGFDARGLELPGHAMSRLHFGEETLDVESTCPRWFRLITDAQRQAELVARATGAPHGPGSAAVDCREVSGVALVATIYYNRGVDLLREKRFAEAVEANTKALWLDPSSATARGNLLATLNNWAIEEGASGRYREAVGLLRTGMALQSDFHPFHVNFIHVHNQWSDELCRQGRFEESCAILRAGEQDLADEPWFAQARLGVTRRWAEASRTDSPLDPATIATPWSGEHFISDRSDEAALHSL